MNRMQQDLHDLGVRLWPDNARLWPRQALDPEQVIGAQDSSARRSIFLVAAVGVATFLVVFGALALGLLLVHKSPQPVGRATAPAGVTGSPPAVTRVEIQVPGNPETLVVAKGSDRRASSSPHVRQLAKRLGSSPANWGGY